MTKDSSSSSVNSGRNEMSSLEDSLRNTTEQLLRAAGVDDEIKDDSYQAAMEDWLGMTTQLHHRTVEDCIPLHPRVYEHAVELLTNAWFGDTTRERILFWKENALLASSLSAQTLRLDRVWPAVRVTKWMEQWMEYNLEESHCSNDNNNNGSIWHHLFQAHGAAERQLIEAFFGHLAETHMLRSHLNAYYQHLRSQNHTTNNNKNTTSNHHPPTDMTARLQHYQFAAAVAERLDAEWEQHMGRIEAILYEMYLHASVHGRKCLRRQLGRLWHDFVHAAAGQSTATSVRQENTHAVAVALSLRLLHSILLGTADESFEQQASSVHLPLVTRHLLPLHQTNALVLWRDQTSVLELYHEPLTQCLAVLLQRQPQRWTDIILPAMLDELSQTGSNTSKQVLLLHETEIYLKLILPDDRAATSPPWWTRLLHVTSKLMASEHSRVAERALTYFQNQSFVAAVQRHYQVSVAALLPSLVQREPSWNPTVRKMTHAILHQLQEAHPEEFKNVCNAVVGSSSSLPLRNKKTPAKASIAGKLDPGVPANASLSAAMGTWRPPPSATNDRHRSTKPKLPSSGPPPPSTITGVAPWAMKPRGSKQQPPLGVAPWANSKIPLPRHKVPLRRASDTTNGNSHKSTTMTTTTSSSDDSGYQRVVTYMEKIKPPQAEASGPSDWSMQQLAETPTLLPSLKFHDLVFGHELGSGAFSVVKYARMIDRSKTRSFWSEYAVKIVSTDRIQELSYEASVQREIAILRGLSHPGIARLVSNFRFRDGAYLVLEYASRGDLHSLLRQHGSMNQESCRFVIGEVAAALASIHSLGLVYSDLKPENIVITEPGHIKLTDFGGCRPVTSEAKQRIAGVAKDLLKNLRDGDWKESNKAELPSDMDNGEDEAMSTEDEAEDLRIEGTTAYLPPEVVMGSFPTIAADSWALGCVMYQCLAGRPPLIEHDDEATRQRIVAFQDSNSGTGMFQQDHDRDIADDARRLIESLLRRNPHERPSMTALADHDFFAGQDIFALHLQNPAPPLDVGTVAPKPDATWSRRQFSSIWSPQPKAYNVAVSVVPPTAATTPSTPRRPLIEGDEASGTFTPVAMGVSTGLTRLSETHPKEPS